MCVCVCVVGVCVCVCVSQLIFLFAKVLAGVHASLVGLSANKPTDIDQQFSSLAPCSVWFLDCGPGHAFSGPTARRPVEQKVDVCKPCKVL